MKPQTTNRIQELKAKQAQELVKAEQEETIRNALAGVPGVNIEDVSICVHDGKRPHCSVTLWNGFGTTRSLADAVAVVQHFKDSIIEGEHWKSGCVSTWPAEINSCIKDKSAVMDGSHAVEIEVRGGKGYGPDVSVQFWTRIAGVLCEIDCPVATLYKLLPSLRGQYRKDGSFSGTITWPVEKQVVDKFRTFWSELPSFNGSYYLADVPNFMAWASNHLSRKAEFEEA